jgi:hypothetical protein
MYGAIEALFIVLLVSSAVSSYVFWAMGKAWLIKRRTDEANFEFLLIGWLRCRIDDWSAPASTENVDGRCSRK